MKDGYGETVLEYVASGFLLQNGAYHNGLFHCPRCIFGGIVLLQSVSV